VDGSRFIFYGKYDGYFDRHLTEYEYRTLPVLKG
jgi:hypothetical protein